MVVLSWLKRHILNYRKMLLQKKMSRAHWIFFTFCLKKGPPSWYILSEKRAPLLIADMSAIKSRFLFLPSLNIYNIGHTQNYNGIVWSIYVHWTYRTGEKYKEGRGFNILLTKTLFLCTYVFPKTPMHFFLLKGQLEKPPCRFPPPALLRRVAFQSRNWYLSLRPILSCCPEIYKIVRGNFLKTAHRCLRIVLIKTESRFLMRNLFIDLNTACFI